MNCNAAVAPRGARFASLLLARSPNLPRRCGRNKAVATIATWPAPPRAAFVDNGVHEAAVVEVDEGFGREGTSGVLDVDTHIRISRHVPHIHHAIKQPPRVDVNTLLGGPVTAFGIGRIS
jgi:hypothetical protein